MKKKDKKRILGGIIATICIVSVICAAAYYWPKSNSSLPPGWGTFSIQVVDGSRGEALDDGDITAELWLFPEDGTDMADWSQWEQQDGTGDSDDIDFVSDIDEDSLRTDHFTAAVVIYSCAGGTDAGEDEGVIYYERQARIYANQLNTLYLYETPNGGAAYLVFNSVTGAYITVASTNITANLNFTVIVATNLTTGNEHQAYVAYWNYEDNDWSHVSLTFTFDLACNAAELNGTPNLTRTHPTTTTLVFSWNYLGQAIQVYNFVWKASPSTVVIVHDTVPVLAFDGVTI